MKLDEIMREGGFIKVADAAERIGVYPTTIYRLIAKGKVETGHAGHVLYVKARSLAEHYREAPPIYRRILAGVGDADATPRGGDGHTQ